MQACATEYQPLSTEATEQAKGLAIGHGVELWQLDRNVAVSLESK
jgi:hypothetical protein